MSEHSTILRLSEEAAVVVAEAIATVVDYDYWRWSGPPLDRIERLEQVFEAVTEHLDAARRPARLFSLADVQAQRELRAQKAARRAGETDRSRKAKIPASLRWTVFRRDGYACVACGAIEDLTADHIEPESLGGLTTLENLQTLCRSCNSRKGARP